MHLKGVEPPHVVPETTALSTELQMHSLYFITKQENNQWVSLKNKYWKILLKRIFENDTMIMFISKANTSFYFMAFQPQFTFLKILYGGDVKSKRYSLFLFPFLQYFSQERIAKYEL